MQLLRRLGRFVRNLFRKPTFTPGEVETSDEVEFETERKRGMRGL